MAGYDEKGEGLPNRSIASLANVRAPAFHVLTTIPGNRFNFMNGTSMASATVSGLLTLAREKYSHLPLKQLFCDSEDLREYRNKFFPVSVHHQ